MAISSECCWKAALDRVCKLLASQTGKMSVCLDLRASLSTKEMKCHLRAIFAFVCLVTLTTGRAADVPPSPPAHTVPEVIQAPAGETFSFAVKAEGVQIYVCQPKKDDPSKLEWVFKAPEADLLDQAGNKIGKHYAGPTWESIDGSKIVGELKARADARESAAIPWLLLTVKKHEGDGIFGHVTSIQRVDTAGGKAPAAGADAATAGQEIRVPYTATYYFYVSEP
jgi:hypothetical protein